MKRPDPRFRFFTLVSRVWHDNLTVAGKTLVGLLLVCLPSLTAIDSGLLPLFASALSLLVTASCVGWIFRPRLQMTRTLPDRVMSGSPCTALLGLSNLASRAALELELRWLDPPKSWRLAEEPLRVARLSAGESVNLSCAVQPNQRGVFAWPPLQVTSAFPLNLVRYHQVIRCTESLHVYPRFEPLVDLDLANAAAISAPEPESYEFRQGGSLEYMGNREYQPGIAVRRWDFRSWARLGRPVVREYFHPRDQLFGLLIDPIVAAADDHSATRDLEDALSRAAALGDYVIAYGSGLSWIAVGRELIALTHLARDQQRRVLFDRLAAVEGQAACSSDRWPLQLTSALRPGMTVFLVATEDSAELDDLVRIMRRVGCDVQHDRDVVQPPARLNGRPVGGSRPLP